MIKEVIRIPEGIKIISDRGVNVFACQEKITSFLKFHDGIVVLVKETPNCVSRNIYRINQFGKLVWQVQRPTEGGDASREFTSLSLRDGKIKAYSWNGVLYTVDYDTGELSEPVFVK